MNKRISLNDGWRINSLCIPGEGISMGFAGDTEPAKKATRSGEWLDCMIPGCVQETLLSNGILPKPYVEDNIDHWRWVEKREWWYRKEFSTPEEKPVRLHFDCLDTCATVYLNGREIATHRNAFRPLIIDVTEYLREDKTNILAVRFDPIEDWSAYRPGDGTSGFPSPHRLHTRKPQFSFGWDIAPRMMTIGIAGNVYLSMGDSPCINCAYVRTLAIDKDGADIELVVEVNHESNITANIADEIVNLSGNGVLRAAVRLKDAVLWNAGAPHLYNACIKTDSGESKEFRFGVRTIELVQEPQDDGGTSFYYRINGKPVFIRGLNWTPGDAVLTRVDKPRIRELVNYAIKANVNLLRVWGGGRYEPDCFYEMCDEAGILVWQDFMLGCGIYPQTDEFTEEIDAEARYQIRRLRHHACLMTWAGDNENDAFYYYAGRMDFRNDRINRTVLAKAVSELDPDTPYIPSSPFSPRLLNPLADTEGDNHLWNHDAPHDASPYAEDRSRFMSEMGRLSLPDMEVIKNFLPDESTRWPLQQPLWRFHCSDTERVHFGDRIESLLKCLAASNRYVPDNLEEMVEATQQLQADAYVYWIEKYAGMNICGGIILWNLADCWPQLSDALIAYPSTPKLAFAAVANAYEKIARNGAAIEKNNRGQVKSLR